MQCVFEWTWFALGFELRWEHGSDARLVVVTDRVWGGGSGAGGGVGLVWNRERRGGGGSCYCTRTIPCFASAFFMRLSHDFILFFRTVSITLVFLYFAFR